jgi:aspartate-semialdehyde dehydrogenase
VPPARWAKPCSRSWPSASFPANLIPLASERSAGERVKCGARSFTVQELDSFDFKGVDIAFFSAGGKVSRVHAPRSQQGRARW